MSSAEQLAPVYFLILDRQIRVNLGAGKDITTTE